LNYFEQGYSDAFAELGPSTVQDFKSLMNCVDGSLSLLAGSRTDFRVKLMCYGRLRVDVFEFRRFYARWLGNPLMKRLKHEIHELLDQAMSWWGEQENYDEMEV